MDRREFTAALSAALAVSSAPAIAQTRTPIKRVRTKTKTMRSRRTPTRLPAIIAKSRGSNGNDSGTSRGTTAKAPRFVMIARVYTSSFGAFETSTSSCAVSSTITASPAAIGSRAPCGWPYWQASRSHRFGSLEEFLTAAMNKLLCDDARRMDEREQEIIEARLKALGYV